MNRLFAAWWTIGAVFLGAGVALADEASHDAASVEASQPGVRFAMPSTTAWRGTTQAVVFGLAEPAEETTVLSAGVEPAGLAELVGELTIVKGARHGVVRLRGLAEGRGELKVAGRAIELTVKPRPTGTLPDYATPRLATPTMGAHVWGKWTAAVEVFDEATAYPGAEREVTLEVEPASGGEVDGVVVEKAWDSGREDGPGRTVIFSVDVSSVEPGTGLRLRAVAEHGGERVAGSWRSVRVVAATPDRLMLVEAEAQKDATLPERYNDRALEVHDDEGASGGALVRMNSSNRPLPIALELEQGGWYQAMAVVRGESGGGAWPTVGLRVDDENDPRTAAVAAIGQGWGRIPVGRPVWLEAGQRTVLYEFEKDFYSRGSDRNLIVDRVELLELGPGRPTLAAPDEPGDKVAANQSGDLTVATDEVWHGRRVTGLWQVDAMVAATNDDGLGAPKVDLLLDGRRLATQTAWWPRFELPATSLREGPMRLQLRASLSDGRVAVSAEQVMIGAPLASSPADASRADAPDEHHRLAIDDADAWDELDDATLEHENRWGRVARLFSNGTIGVRLPQGLEGQYEFALRAHADEFDGGPIAEVKLRDADDAVLHAFEPLEVRRGWREVDLGRATLDGSAARLTLAFTNDKYDGSEKRDRNLHVAALIIRRLPADDAPDAPPAVELRYPVAGAVQHDADAVVADLRDDYGVAWAELLIDGEPTGQRVQPLPGDARAVLPVVWRHRSPGEHAVAVRVRDNAGQFTDSTPVNVRVLADPPTQPTAYARAVRLLDRFAFGPEPDELAELLINGPEAYLRDALTTGWADAGVASAWQLSLARHSDNQVPHRAATHLLRTPNPVRARLTMFVDNHFNTWLRKAGRERKADEHERFVELGAAPFLALFEASATSPAMLHYLDQSRSFAKRINENYAREIMELHTLGVDSSYSQEDVTELSHALAGWLGTDDYDAARLPRRPAYRYQFVPVLNDGKPRIVFGLDLPKAKPVDRYDRARRVVEMLAAHPDTARHLARKLVAYYLVSPAPDELVDHLADTYLKSGGDLDDVFFALASHPYATNDDLPPRLQRPLEFAVGLQRRVGDASPWRIINFLNRSGNGLFDHETPDGYDAEPQSYANSNAMLQRWRLARELEWPLSRLIPGPMQRLDNHPRWQALPDDQRDAAWAQAVIDTLAVRLTGHPLSTRSNRAARDVLDAAPDNINHRARLIATLVAQLPEAQQQR